MADLDWSSQHGTQTTEAETDNNDASSLTCLWLEHYHTRPITYNQDATVRTMASILAEQHLPNPPENIASF